MLTSAMLRRVGQPLCAVLLFAASTLAAHAEDELRITAKAAILLDADTGQVLYAREPHLPLPPASTTKVLTALIALERLNPNAMLPVSPSAAEAPPSRVGLRPGDRISANDALYGLLLKSGNDTAEVVAESIGGSVPGFARLMNARARQLGALDSHFANPHGLPNDEHQSTAYDLAVIFRYAMLNPQFERIVQTQNQILQVERASAQGRAQPVMVATHNRLLGTYDGAMGGKTGYTVKAKRCYVGETERGNHRLIVAVLGSSALWEDSRKLFDYGFARYGLATPPQAAPIPVRVTAPARAVKASTRSVAAPRKASAPTAKSTKPAPRAKTVAPKKPAPRPESRVASRGRG